MQLNIYISLMVHITGQQLVHHHCLLHQMSPLLEELLKDVVLYSSGTVCICYRFVSSLDCGEEVMYASVSCHHEITRDRATIAIIQFILMILMFLHFHSL